MGRKGKVFLLLFTTVLLLCGCGEEKKANKYLEEGKYKEAIEVYETLLSEKDSKSAKEKNQELYALMGQAYSYLEDYENALECLNQAMELSEEEIDKELYLYRGLAYEKQHLYKEAAGDYESYFAHMSDEEKAKEKEEELPAEEYANRVFAYNELGLCYMKQENYEKALGAIEAGLLLKSETEKEETEKKESLLKNKVVVLEYLGRFEEAFAECGAYLETYPGDEEMKREYEFLKTRQ